MLARHGDVCKVRRAVTNTERPWSKAQHPAAAHPTKCGSHLGGWWGPWIRRAGGCRASLERQRQQHWSPVWQNKCGQCSGRRAGIRCTCRMSAENWLLVQGVTSHEGLICFCWGCLRFLKVAVLTRVYTMTLGIITKLIFSCSWQLKKYYHLCQEAFRQSLKISSWWNKLKFT